MTSNYSKLNLSMQQPQNCDSSNIKKYSQVIDINGLIEGSENNISNEKQEYITNSLKRAVDLMYSNSPKGCIYEEMPQYYYHGDINNNLNKNIPFGTTKFYELGPEKDKCYKPYYNHTLGYQIAMDVPINPKCIPSAKYQPWMFPY